MTGRPSVVLAVLLGTSLLASCGLKGPLTVPEKSRNIVIRTSTGQTTTTTGGTTTTPGAATTPPPTTGPAPTTPSQPAAPAKPKSKTPPPPDDDHMPPPPLPGSNPGTSRGG